MPLKKALVEVPILAGLKQKTDPRKLPLGASASAVNFVADKKGRLTKRLGLFPLANTVQTTPAYSPSTGLDVAGWNAETNNTPMLIGRGTWSPTGATVTTLQSYSDDQGSWVMRGLPPEVNIVKDQIVADGPDSACAPSSIVHGDYQMIVWVDTAISGASTAGTAWYCVIENSTGEYAQSPQVLDSTNTGIGLLRIALVGTVAVVVYCLTSAGNPIYGKALDASQWTTTTLGSVSPVNFIADAQQPGFDMRAIGGDLTNFALCYVNASGGTTQLNVQAWNTTFSAHTSVVIQTTATATELTRGPNALRADTTNGIACAYWFHTSGGTKQLKAAVVAYPAMTILGTAANLYPVVNTNEQDGILAVGYTGTISGNPSWIVGWSPIGSRFNAFGVSPTSGGVGFTAPESYNCAQIVTCQFFVSGGVVTKWSNASPRRTYGVYLVSNWLETNGIVYCLGWIPSATQGGYLMLAADYANNATDGSPPTEGGGGNPYCLRPCANIQTRTALSDPIALELIEVGGGSAFNISINSQSGLAGWNLGTDAYATAYVCYVASTQGQRTMVATGQIQMAPAGGHPSAQYGTLLCYGGALPTCYDGANLFEQSFLYTPEDIVWSQSNPAGSNFVFNAATDAWSWIFTYEQFDNQGNFHLSGRSPPVTISGANVAGSFPSGSMQFQFYVPNLGVTMRDYVWPTSFAPTMNMPPPGSPVMIGMYRTVRNGLVYLRMSDPQWTGTNANQGPITNVLSSPYALVTDNGGDNLAVLGPDLYGDGSTGAPGNLDNLCPPATPVQVLHKERLWVARGNQVQYSKARSELVGPGYDDQVKIFTVGGDDPIIDVASMDDKLVILKADQNYYVDGAGPGDDGSGALFDSPQPIPTDLGCSRTGSAISGPEGIYYMSTGGLRLVSRALSVDYVGGPVEDELTTYPTLMGAVYYPQNNRILFLANQGDVGSPEVTGELLVRDYVLDAWTTAVITNGAVQTGFVSATIANGAGLSGSLLFKSAVKPRLHLLAADGIVWREHDPIDVGAYYDNDTYVSSIWTSPVVVELGDQAHAGSAQGRIRLWDILAIIDSLDPHGLIISVGMDYGPLGQNRIWTWQTGPNQIAPGGVTPTPLTQLRTYDGRMGEAFQIQIQDVEDASSVSGQGAQLLGLTLALGIYEGPYKLPGGSTQ